MKTKLLIAFTILFMTSSCVTKSSNDNSENENGLVAFENGDLMTEISVDIPRAMNFNFLLEMPPSQAKSKFGSQDFNLHGITILTLVQLMCCRVNNS